VKTTIIITYTRSIHACTHVCMCKIQATYASYNYKLELFGDSTMH